MDNVQVSQEAREAAADAVKAYRDNKNHDWQARIRRGECDDGYMVQAFAKFERDTIARHRQSAEREEEEAHKIGIDEGRQEMVREIDLATGGDGEFRYCTDHDPDCHCPNAEAMKDRVLERFAARHRLAERTGQLIPAPSVGKPGWDVDGICNDHGVFCCKKCALPDPTVDDAALVERVARAIRRSEIGNFSDEVRAQSIVDGSWEHRKPEATAAIAAMQVKP